MKGRKRREGITLIALVITIIILLILAGVSLLLLSGSDGILQKATTAVNKTQKSAIEEELNLEITRLRMEAVEQEKTYHIKYIAENLPINLEDCICNLTNDEREIEGEYKDYIFTIDEQCVVQVESKVGGIKPEITAEVMTEGYILEGENAEIEIRVKATITEGMVSILAPEGVSLKSTITDTEKEKVYVYTTTTNASYTFIALGDSDRKDKATVKVNQMIDKPRINITNNTGTSVIINVENDYPAEVRYTYYLGEMELISDTSQRNYKMEDLDYYTDYTVKVVVHVNSTNVESDVLNFSTSYLAPTIKVTGNFERTPLEYPLMTTSGMMNCTTNLTEGTELIIEIANETNQEMTTYYSIDDGETWLNDKSRWEIEYTGNYKVKAKNVNREGEEFVSQAIYADGYAYDFNVSCTATDALTKKAYDGDGKTYYEYNREDEKGRFNIKNDVVLKQICFKLEENRGDRMVVNWIGGNTSWWIREGNFLAEGIWQQLYWGTANYGTEAHLHELTCRTYEMWCDLTL